MHTAKFSVHKYNLKNTQLGMKEVSWWSGALADLTEDLSLG